MTKQIHIGKCVIGGGAPVVVQSMCNTPASDARATLLQIGRLAELGCSLIRVAFPSFACADALRQICSDSPLPVIADIHFDHRLALLAMECGAMGIRVNPGNIHSAEGIAQVAQRAAELNRCVRIGVNMGSLSPAAQEKYGRTSEAMVQSALEYLEIFEKNGCRNLKVSLKSSDIRMTLEACRRFHQLCDYPQHLGLTEAGTPNLGEIRSAVGIGALLLEGIGDTIRVSLTAPPETEIIAAYRLLDAIGLRPGRPRIVSCPTCGRTRIHLIHLAEQVEQLVNDRLNRKIPIHIKKIAVMGCEVNGPGEAADADLGIAGGNGSGVIFQYGKILKRCPENTLLAEFEKLL